MKLCSKSIILCFSIVFVVISFLCHIIALITNFWLKSKDDSIDFLNIGLWVACFKGFIHPHERPARLYDGCHGITSNYYGTIQDWLQPSWLVVCKILAIIGLILQIVGIIFVIILILWFICKCFLCEGKRDCCERFLIYATPIIWILAGVYRFVVLFFNCMLTFGSYFCFDMPSVLQDLFQSPYCDGNWTLIQNCAYPNQTCNITKCGLGMTPDEYNLLYAIYAWTNAVVVIAAGFLIDKLGNRIGVFTFSFLCLFGSALFALGAMFPNTPYLLPMMLGGRLLFGAGNGSLTIVQNRITAYWFRNKELAMAFGITLAFSRLGSVLNFLLTDNFANTYGLSMTLWGGTILCGLGFVSAFIVSFLDIHGIKQLGEVSSMQAESKKLHITDIRHFSLQYWLLTLALMFFYNGVFPFIADASDFIQTKYGYSEAKSSYIAGAAYDVSMILSPFLGRIIDTIGMRGYLALACALFTVPVYGLLAFTHIFPLICILWLGFTYSCAAASMWPSIPLVVSQTTVGTAMGITTSIQMVGIGICNLVVGVILGKKYKDLPADAQLAHWKYMMIFLLANTLACVVTTALLNIVDKRKDGVLNQSRSERLQKERIRAVREGSQSPDNTQTLNTSGYGESEEGPNETDPLIPKPQSPSVNS